jgi:5-(carboxyamino)imidazole ribonucleotide synthase
MDPRPTPIARVGIVGGGQLARMLVRAASRLGCECVVLDPYEHSPAGHVAARQIVGRFDDPAKLRELVEACEVTTFDLEDVDAGVMQALVDEGNVVHPAPSLLATIQDKLLQKRAFESAGIPVSPFVEVDPADTDAFADFGYPLVQKARRGGYDGRGVAVLRSADDLDGVLPVPSFVERFIPCEKELAVMVARSEAGDARAYPVVEMTFKEGANVLDALFAPARVADDVAERAQALARRCVEALDGVGVFGVELFYSPDGDEELIVNEVSPRTHNSGHYTIEACLTDQFEQHLRAVLGLPLGATEQMWPAVMINLLGEAGASGPAWVEGLDEALATDGVSVHLYGKTETRPGRKMGHITVVDSDLEAASKKAARVAGVMRVTAKEKA